MRLLRLLLEELLEELHLVVGGQRCPRARGLRAGCGKEHPGRGGQHGLLGVRRGLERREDWDDPGQSCYRASLQHAACIRGGGVAHWEPRVSRTVSSTDTDRALGERRSDLLSWGWADNPTRTRQ